MSIKTYIIDGNNLIGKIKRLSHLQKKDKQTSRDQLSFMLDRYFRKTKVKVSLHLDGFENTPIETGKIKIKYSGNQPADNLIKKEIENSKNPKLLIVISSDHSILGFAKACSCETIKSEVFAKELSRKDDNESEEKIIKSIDEDEIKKLFGV